MANFGEAVSDQPMSQIVEAPALALSKLGGPGATDVVIGSTFIPAVLVTANTQILSGRIIGVPQWDRTEDVTIIVAVGLDALEVNNDTWDIDFDYIFAESGVAADADLNKTVTSLTPTLTVTTAEGLIDETLYSLSFTLDRNDANNPYVSATGGGFGFALNQRIGSVITSMNIIAIAIEFPILQ